MTEAAKQRGVDSTRFASTRTLSGCRSVRCFSRIVTTSTEAHVAIAAPGDCTSLAEAEIPNPHALRAPTPNRLAGIQSALQLLQGAAFRNPHLVALGQRGPIGRLSEAATTKTRPSTQHSAGHQVARGLVASSARALWLQGSSRVSSLRPLLVLSHCCNRQFHHDLKRPCGVTRGVSDTIGGREVGRGAPLRPTCSR